MPHERALNVTNATTDDFLRVKSTAKFVLSAPLSDDDRTVDPAHVLKVEVVAL